MNSFFLEIRNFFTFFSSDFKQERSLVFYSEGPVYTRFLKPVVEEIQKRSNLSICYITSDIKDPLLEKSNEKFKVFYFRKLLAFVFAFLDSKALVMTTPDLGNYHLKRSSNGDVKYFYLFHAMVSTHMIYRRHAFDHFDAVFCVGPHQEKELRKAEALYSTKAKELISGGYLVLDQIHEDFKAYKTQNVTGESRETVCLIAPSWAPGNILESCLEELLDVLAQESGVKAILRPHPEFVKKNKSQFNAIQEKFKDFKNIIFEVNATNNDSLYKADILITDWSGIAMEYCFGTERPVIYMDTPKKVNNPKYEELEIEPLEVSIRSKIGKILKLEDISTIHGVIEELMAQKDEYHKKICDERSRLIYSFLTSKEVCADHIINFMQTKTGEKISEA